MDWEFAWLYVDCSEHLIITVAPTFLEQSRVRVIAFVMFVVLYKKELKSSVVAKVVCPVFTVWMQKNKGD